HGRPAPRTTPHYAKNPGTTPKRGVVTRQNYAIAKGPRWGTTLVFPVVFGSAGGTEWGPENRSVAGSIPALPTGPNHISPKALRLPPGGRGRGFRMPGFAGTPAIRRVSECHAPAVVSPSPVATRAPRSSMFISTAGGAPSPSARGAVRRPSG